jgi:hypothetical protein
MEPVTPMIEFRQAKLFDIPSIVELAVESVSQNPLPVKISRAAMVETLEGIVGRPQHFCWVGVKDGSIVSAVVAQTSFGFWFERQQCSVLMYYTRVKGGCFPLLRKFAQWVKSRPAIKIAVFELEPESDPRLSKALSKLGFARQSLNMTYVRNA